MSNLTREQIELEQELNRILERRAALQGGLNAASSAQVNLSSQSAAAIENQSAARGRDRTSQQASLDQMEAMGNATEENTKKKGWATKASELYNKSLATMQNLYKSVIAPLKTFYSTFVTFSWLYDSAAEAAAGYSAQAREMFEAQQATIDAFGALTGDTQKRFKEFMSSATSGANSFSKSGRGLRSVWGLGVSAVLTNMTAIYKEFGNEAALLSEKINDNASAMILYKESLHISYEAQKLMMKGAHDSKEEFANLSKTIVSGSKIAGVSIKNVGTNIDAAAKDFKNFGWMTKKELADTSIYATKLGFDIAELTGFADKFDTFEGAAESIGKLSAAFGIQLDTMDMVMEDNPAKKLDMVREALERSGRSIKDIAGNRREMQYLADTIGLPIDKIKEMSEVSMDEFGFAKLSEETAAANKKMNEQDALNDIAKNMKTISDGMKDLDPTGFFGNFTKGFKDFMEHSGMYHHAMGRISKSLRAFYDIGKEVASAVSSLFYQPKKDGTNGAPMADLFEAYLDYFDRMGAAAKQVGEKIKKIFEFLGQIYSGKLLDDAKKGKIDNIIDWLMDPFIDANTSAATAQGLMNPTIRNGIAKIGAVVIDIFAGILRKGSDLFAGFVSGLFNPEATDKAKQAFLKPKVLASLKKSFSGLWTTLGEVFDSVLSNGDGLYIYLVGGIWQGKKIDEKESLLGGAWIKLNEWFAGPRAGAIVGSISTGFANFMTAAFGFGTGATSSAGAALSKGWDVMVAMLGSSLKLAMMKFWNLTVDIAFDFKAKIEKGIARGLKLTPILGLLGYDLDTAQENSNKSMANMFKFDIEKQRRVMSSELDKQIAMINEVAKSKAVSAKSKGEGVTPEDAIQKQFAKLDSQVGGDSDMTTNMKNIESIITTINEKITAVKENMNSIDVGKMTAIIGAGTGTKLKATLPEKVVVETEKLQIRLSLNVQMDSRDIAHSMAENGTGEYFFTPNPLHGDHKTS